LEDRREINLICKLQNWVAFVTTTIHQKLMNSKQTLFLT
jgi:hypothetical protein